MMTSFVYVLFILAFFIYNALIFILLYRLIRDKRDPIRTLGWMLVILLIPVFGILVYVFLGINLKKEKLFDKKKYLDVQINIEYDQNHVERARFLHLKPGLSSLLTILSTTHSKFTLNNEVKILKDGEMTFNQIFAALKNARHHIHIEYYIIEDGELANQLKEILLEKASQGIEIRIIYDDVGSWRLSNAYIAELEGASIDICPFLPVRFPKFTSRINYRNHRKIIVVDGQYGFLGGVNIADKYLKEHKFEYWRDTHLQIKGEAVRTLQHIFSADWYFTQGELIGDTEKYYPKFTFTEQCPVQIIASGPDSFRPFIMDAYFVAITTARKSICITSPYLLPNSSILQALKAASLRGIDVKIILPQKADSKLVHLATLSYIDELLEANMNIYFYTKGFIHSKVMIVDSLFATVGTTNMDFRSFEHNLEANAFLFQEEAVKALKNDFNDDISDSEKVTLEKWNKRHKQQKVKESFARVFAPIL